MRSSSEIRQDYIDFFTKKCGHTFVASSPVVPLDDPSLLFANAGMNQFKPYFLGTEKPKTTRVANTQKCIRAGGKHNDLDDVGKDTYHHTFFEMLGNWSFGDYFKQEAITWAWELLTQVWKLDVTRLHVTVFEGDLENGIPRDDEAAEIWKSVGVLPGHIHLGNKKDNFWEMGETGPCGPCTEIHFDRTPDKSGASLVNGGSPLVIEIWNNVFIQFNRNPDKSLTPLPAKHVDTGMGFERICAVMNGLDSNYDTDVFTPIFEALREITGSRPYTAILEDLTDIAYRVIADHIRTLTFALTDGAHIGNVGRDYVLKRILRRAERYGRQCFNTTEPFLHKLVPVVVNQLGDVFPELKRNPEKVRSEIYEEEVAFLKTLDRGIKLFRTMANTTTARGSKVISGPDAFKLHDTFGLYIDLTEQMASEVGLTVDKAGYDEAMNQAKDLARKGGKKFIVTAIQGDLPKTDDLPKYDNALIEAKVLGWVIENKFITTGKLEAGQEAGVVLDRTNFYAEQGGQVGDVGTIDKMATPGIEFQVEDTQRLGDTVLHFGTLVDGFLAVGDQVMLMQGTLRRIDVMRNHTATHLMNLALKKVLGQHVEQKGSLVDDEKTRFDFSHDKPLSREEIAAIEQQVNRLIHRDSPVTAVTMPLAEAKNLPGVRAVFGEKYPDPVRVVLIGPDTPAQATHDDSIEFCGGTHLPRTGNVGLFKIVSQDAVQKGVRRVTAVTGRMASETVGTMSQVVADLSAKFVCTTEEIPQRVESLQTELKATQTLLKKAQAALLGGTIDELLVNAETIGTTKVVIGKIPSVDIEAVRTQVDRIRQKAGSSYVVLFWEEGEKVSLLVGLTADVVAKGLKAGEVAKTLAGLMGGSGGGKPDMAQAAGKDPSQLPAALTEARRLASKLA
jgi:alanyl-tRNA synthetase